MTAEQGDAAVSHSLDAAILRVRDVRGNTVGLGFLVSTHVALTCAHVVSAAFGSPDGAVPDAAARLHLETPLLPGPASRGPNAAATTATVEHFVPPQSSGVGDVAVLRLDAALPGTRPARMVEAPELMALWEHPARAFGFPAGRPAGVWHAGILRARQANGWVQADLSGSGYRVSGGFSGTPVWDDSLGGVVGMMAVAEAGDPPTSYMIPTDRLVAAWPELRDLVRPATPFRSLTPFVEADASIFHGRADESAAVARMVAAGQWTTIIGPSGSGKSSLAMAGVLPRVCGRPSSAVVMRPAHPGGPLYALAEAVLPLLEPRLSEVNTLAEIPKLAKVLSGQGLHSVVRRVLEVQALDNLVIVVDQFEELVEATPTGTDRFVEILFGGDLPATIKGLITLRADFLEAVLADPSLAAVVGQDRQTFLLAPMRPEQLREAITAPLDGVPGVRFEPGLVDRILADVGAGSGALPLVGFTLDQLWRRQSRGMLTYAAYENLGGVSGALRVYADSAWQEQVRSEGDEAVARRLFTQLVRVPIGSAGATRRRVPRAELDEYQWSIAGRLATTRLLVIEGPQGGETVELAHEALITAWGKLATWAGEDREFLVWRESLKHDIERWQEAKHQDTKDKEADEFLPTATALAAALPWLRERGTVLSQAERDYLEAGRLHRRSQDRRRRWFFSGLGIATALALVLGGLFAYARNQSHQRDVLAKANQALAKDNAALATSRALTQASQDEATPDPVLSAMLALAAYQTSPTQEARSQLLRVYLTYLYSARDLSGLLGKVGDFQVSRDGNVVLATSTLGRAFLFVHALNGTVRMEPVPAPQQVRYPMVSADGTRAAFVQAGSGIVEWFDVNADAAQPVGKIHQLPSVPGKPIDPNFVRFQVTMSADGHVIAAQVGNDLVWWNLDAEAFVGTAPAPANASIHLWVDPDGKTVMVDTVDDPAHYGLVAGDSAHHGLVAIDTATGHARTVLSGLPDETDKFLLSGDRTTIVLCHDVAGATTIRLLRVSDGTPVGSPYTGESNQCSMAAADASGHRIVLDDFEQGVHLVDLDKGTVLSTAPVVADSDVYSPDLLSANGKLYLIGQHDSLITYTELPTAQEPQQVAAAALTNDGSKKVIITADGSALQLRATDGTQLFAQASRLKPYQIPDPNRSNALHLSPGGTLLADQEGPDLVSIRKVATLEQTAQVTVALPSTTDGSTPNFRYFFDSTGQLVTVSGTHVQQWDARTGVLLASFDTAIFHPQLDDTGAPAIWVGSYPGANQVAVVVEGDPVIKVVDLRTGRTTATVTTTDDAVAVNFDPSGRFFALLRHGSVIELWRRDPLRKELGPFRSVDEDGITTYAEGFIDGDGHYAIAAHDMIRIYQVGKPAYTDSYAFGEPGRGIRESSYSFVDISANGKVVLYRDWNDFARTLTLDPQKWTRDLCEIIGYRQFTPAEKSALPVPVPDQPVCTPGG